MGEDWDEGDNPHLTPLPQGERKSKPVDTLSLDVKELFKHTLRMSVKGWVLLLGKGETKRGFRDPS